MRRMSFSLISVLTTIGLLSSGYAGWIQRFGGGGEDRGLGGAQGDDGGYVFLASTTSFGAGGEDVMTIKCDSQGYAEYIYTYGGKKDDWASTLVKTSDGGYAFICHSMRYTDSLGYPNMCFFKVGAEGDTVWMKHYYRDGPDAARHFVQTSDGGYAILTDAGDSTWVLKTSETGDTMWNFFYECPDCEGFSICEASDRGYLVTGTSKGENDLSDLWVLRISPEKETVWTKTYGGENIDGGYSICPTSEGNYLIAGETITAGQDGRQMWLLKITERSVGEFTVCDTLWTRTLGGSRGEAGEWVIQASDGNYVAAGWTESRGEGGADFLLVKTDPEGDTLWSKTFGGEDDDYANSVAETLDSGYVLTGYTTSFESQSSDVWVVKTDSQGRLAVTEDKGYRPKIDLEATSLGSVIRIRYSSRPEGLLLDVFDATGRKVDQINSAGSEGSITWGRGYGPGVYFIKTAREYDSICLKAVLIK